MSAENCSYCNARPATGMVDEAYPICETCSESPDDDLKRGDWVSVVYIGRMVGRPRDETARVSVKLDDGSAFWTVVPTSVIKRMKPVGDS